MIFLIANLNYRPSLAVFGSGFRALLKELLCARGPNDASSSARNKNFLSNGEVFDLLYPITSRGIMCRLEPSNLPRSQNRDPGHPQRKRDGLFQTREISKLVTNG